MNENELEYGLAFHFVNFGNIYYCGKEGETYLFLNDKMSVNQREESSQSLIKFNLPLNKLEYISNQRWINESKGEIEYYSKENTKFQKYLDKLNKVPSRLIAA